MTESCSGRVEEYENWRFQVRQFLSQELYFVEFLEWIENDLYSEEQHYIAGQEKIIEHEEIVQYVCVNHSGAGQERRT